MGHIGKSDLGSKVVRLSDFRDNSGNRKAHKLFTYSLVQKPVFEKTLPEKRKLFMFILASAGGNVNDLLD